MCDSNPKKYLIIGNGNMGQRYAKILRDLDRYCSIYYKHRNMRYSSLEERGFDATFICTPSNSHVEELVSLQETIGPVPTLIEKPLVISTGNEFQDDLNVRNLEQMFDYSVENGIAMYVAYNLRFTMAIERISKAIKNSTGSLIRPLAVCKTNYKNWFGKRDLDDVIYELSHEIDYLVYMFGPVSGSSRFTTKDKKRTFIVMRHSSGVVSRAYLDMKSEYNARYFQLHPISDWDRIYFMKDDVEFSYQAQLEYFLKNLNMPALSGNIAEALRIENV